MREDAERCHRRHAARAQLHRASRPSHITRKIEGNRAYRIPWLSLPTEDKFVQACERVFLAMPLQYRKYSPVWCYLLLPLLVVLEEKDVLPAFQAILHRLQGMDPTPTASNKAYLRSQTLMKKYGIRSAVL